MPCNQAPAWHRVRKVRGRCWSIRATGTSALLGKSHPLGRCWNIREHPHYWNIPAFCWNIRVAGTSALLEHPRCWNIRVAGTSALLEHPRCWNIRATGTIRTTGTSALLEHPRCWNIRVAGTSAQLNRSGRSSNRGGSTHEEGKGTVARSTFPRSRAPSKKVRPGLPRSRIAPESPRSAEEDVSSLGTHRLRPPCFGSACPATRICLYTVCSVIHRLVLTVTAYRLPLTVYRLPSTVYRLPSTVYRLPSTVYRLPSTAYHPPSTVHNHLHPLRRLGKVGSDHAVHHRPGHLGWPALIPAQSDNLIQ